MTSSKSEKEKINMNQISNKIIRHIQDFFYLDIASWILLIASCLMNIVLYYLWAYKNPFEPNLMYIDVSVFLANSIISFIYFKKDKIVTYFLLSSSVLVSVFTYVYIAKMNSMI
jgi:hypothetical protein